MLHGVQRDAGACRELALIEILAEPQCTELPSKLDLQLPWCFHVSLTIPK